MKKKNVLFLCTGNSARSILAEVALNDAAGGSFRAYSAGSTPVGKVNPVAISTLKKFGLPTEGLRSKSWDEFSGLGTENDAPELDLVVTVCGNAAGETCPIWPGRSGSAPLSAHWGLPDPAVFEGSEVMKQAEFETAFSIIRRRIKALLDIDMDAPDKASVKAKLDAIADIS